MSPETKQQLVRLNNALKELNNEQRPMTEPHRSAYVRRKQALAADLKKIVSGALAKTTPGGAE